MASQAYRIKVGNDPSSTQGKKSGKLRIIIRSNHEKSLQGVVRTDTRATLPLESTFLGTRYYDDGEIDHLRCDLRTWLFQGLKMQQSVVGTPLTSSF